MAHYGLGTARMATKEFPSAVTAFEAARLAFQTRAEKNKQLMFRTQGAREDRMRKLRDAIRNNSTGASGRAGDGGPGVGGRAAVARAGGRGHGTGAAAARAPARASAAPYFRTGRLPEAEREYKAAIDAQPKLGEARSNLAVIFLMTGRPKEAQEQVKLAKKHGFKPPAGLVADIDKAVAEGPKTSN